jgi:hypothetical protein
VRAGSLRPETRCGRPTLLAVSEHVDPDLETVAPLPADPSPAPDPGPTPRRAGRRPLAALVAALAVVSLVVGFGVATIVVNARDSSPNRAVTVAPDDSVLGAIILQQSDAPAGDKVTLLSRGADLTVATLDLCNGRFASEAQRIARRQVALTDAQGNLLLSTEAILYRAPSGGAQAIRELKSVAAKCPSTPVASPVGEETRTTRFRSAPDGAWPRTPSVERLAYDFVATDATTGESSHSVAVYLRRGRVLMGLYFARPDARQAAIDGRTAIAGIVGVFETRMAKIPARVAGG